MWNRPYAVLRTVYNIHDYGQSALLVSFVIVWRCSKINAMMIIKPPVICSGARASPKMTKAMLAPATGSKILNMPAVDGNSLANPCK